MRRDAGAGLEPDRCPPILTPGNLDRRLGPPGAARSADGRAGRAARGATRRSRPAPGLAAFALHSRLATGEAGRPGAARRRQSSGAAGPWSTVHPRAATAGRCRRSPIRSASTSGGCLQARPGVLAARQADRSRYPAVLAAMAERPLAINEIEAILRAEMGRTEIPPNRPLWRHFSGTGAADLVHLPRSGTGGPLPPRRGVARAAAPRGGRPGSGGGPPGPPLPRRVRTGQRRGPRRVRGTGPERRSLARRGEGDGRRAGRFVDEKGRISSTCRGAAADPDAPARPPPRPVGQPAARLRDQAPRAVLPAAHQATSSPRTPTCCPPSWSTGWWPGRGCRAGARREAAARLRPFGRLKAKDRDALEAEGSCRSLDGAPTIGIPGPTDGFEPDAHDHPRRHGRVLRVGRGPRRSARSSAAGDRRRAARRPGRGQRRIVRGPRVRSSAMPLRTAARLCPQAAFLPGRFERYAEVSRGDGSSTTTPRWWSRSAWTRRSSTSPAHRPGTGRPSARRSRTRVRDEVGLVVSVGVATNKLVAKVASDLRKPDALVIVPPGEEAEFLAPLPVTRLWGVDRASGRRWPTTVATSASWRPVPDDTLRRRFGRMGSSSGSGRGASIGRGSPPGRRRSPSVTSTPSPPMSPSGPGWTGRCCGSPSRWPAGCGGTAWRPAESS